jgi:hypothetical protein
MFGWKGDDLCADPYSQQASARRSYCLAALPCNLPDRATAGQAPLCSMAGTPADAWGALRLTPCRRAQLTFEPNSTPQQLVIKGRLRPAIRFESPGNPKIANLQRRNATALRTLGELDYLRSSGHEARSAVQRSGSARRAPAARRRARRRAGAALAGGSGACARDRAPAGARSAPCAAAAVGARPAASSAAQGAGAAAGGTTAAFTAV